MESRNRSKIGRTYTHGNQCCSHVTAAVMSARDLRGYGGRRRLAASLGVKPPRRGV